MPAPLGIVNFAGAAFEEPPLAGEGKAVAFAGTRRAGDSLTSPGLMTIFILVGEDLAGEGKRMGNDGAGGGGVEGAIFSEAMASSFDAVSVASVATIGSSGVGVEDAGGSTGPSSPPSASASTAAGAESGLSTSILLSASASAAKARLPSTLTALGERDPTSLAYALAS